jgi:ATP-dependent exoDNAse (exonuclease V) beta subunit
MHAVVDRTFVDPAGTRWFFDYKTSQTLDGEVQSDFYQREGERYREQLNRYAELFRSLEPARAVRAALYFPMGDGWCEIPLAGQGKAGKI